MNNKKRVYGKTLIDNIIEDYYGEFETNDFDFYNDLNNY